MTSVSITAILLFFSLAVALGLAARLITTGLVRVYPLFFCFVCLTLVIQGTALIFGLRDIRYFYVYAYVDPLRVFISILVIWELFRVIFRNYAGLRSLSQWVMVAAASIALLGFILSISGTTVSESQYLRALTRLERGVAFGLVIFIVVMLYFISRYPIRLPRNIVAHCMLYSIWFITDAAYLMGSIFVTTRAHANLLNQAETVLEIACYLGWMLLLSREGEFRETQSRRQISRDAEQALIIELDSLNQVLERAGRSIFKH